MTDWQIVVAHDGGVARIQDGANQSCGKTPTQKVFDLEWELNPPPPDPPPPLSQPGIGLTVIVILLSVFTTLCLASGLALKIFVELHP